MNNEDYSCNKKIIIRFLIASYLLVPVTPSERRIKIAPIIIAKTDIFEKNMIPENYTFTENIEHWQSSRRNNLLNVICTSVPFQSLRTSYLHTRSSGFSYGDHKWPTYPLLVTGPRVFLTCWERWWFEKENTTLSVIFQRT